MLKILSSRPSLRPLTKLLAVLWVLIKWILRLSLYFAFFYVVYHNYNRWWLKDNYYYFTFGGDIGEELYGQIWIPKDIVKSRDCDALYRWQHEFVPRDLQGLCPFAPLRDKRKVGMADLWFDFPRKYFRSIFTPSGLSDGFVSALFGEWNYPDMSISNTYERQISFFMQDTKRGRFVYEEPLKFWYDSFLHLNKYSTYEIIFINYDKEMQMAKYQVKKKIIGLDNKPTILNRYLYTNDDPKTPSYFVVCESENTTRCNSVVLYKNLISIEYTMPRELLEHHEAIKNQLLNFMREYEIEAPY